MPSISSKRRHYNAKYTEICIGNISSHTEPNKLLQYFTQYGDILQYNSTSPTGGYVFITYKDPSIVDECMKGRPHYLDGRHLYVKRALPIDDEHPRERFETTRDLMIVVDYDNKNCSDKEFLIQLRDYFSKYGRLYACKYCDEANFSYILVEFADKDNVDRIILDKPHCYNGQPLNVMKYIPSNIEIMNKKYASKRQLSSVIKDAIDDDTYDFTQSRTNSNINEFTSKEPISEVDLENEVYRLQDIFKKMNEDFAAKRRQFEDECEEELQKIHKDTHLANYLQQDLEQEYAKLLVEYEALKQDNEALNEQYLAAELENFEITSYYEQILAEEKAKTAQLEAEYKAKSKASKSSQSSTPSSPCLINISSTSKSPPPSITPEDNN